MTERIWVVIDKRGIPWDAKRTAHAATPAARERDVIAPSLAPHRVEEYWHLSAVEAAITRGVANVLAELATPDAAHLRKMVDEAVALELQAAMTALVRIAELPASPENAEALAIARAAIAAEAAHT